LRREKRATEITRIVLVAMALGAFGVGEVVFSIPPASAGPTALSGERARKSLGVFVAPVPPGAKGTLLLDKDRGMIVVGLVSGGLADQAGLRRGDVLLAIDGRPVNRESDLAAALSAASGAGQVLAEVSRQGKVLDIAIAF
jgi:serine protease Do